MVPCHSIVTLLVPCHHSFVTLLVPCWHTFVTLLVPCQCCEGKKAKKQNWWRHGRYFQRSCWPCQKTSWTALIYCRSADLLLLICDQVWGQQPGGNDWWNPTKVSAFIFLACSQFITFLAASPCCMHIWWSSVFFWHQMGGGGGGGNIFYWTFLCYPIWSHIV